MVETNLRELRCQASFQGHRWDDPPIPPGMVLKTNQVYMRCERCGNAKIVTLDGRSGATVSSRYIYADTYRGTHGMTKRDWNREWLRRIRSKK